MKTACHTIIDDSCFLALVDLSEYEGYIQENWQIEELKRRFLQQMQQRRLLIWGTGMENEWNVAVHFESSERQGFREVTGFIHASEGRLFLTNFESLTLIAQYPDVNLDQEDGAILIVEKGMYQCRIVELHNHDYDAADAEAFVDTATHYTLELTRVEIAGESWSEIPWSDL